MAELTALLHKPESRSASTGIRMNGSELREARQGMGLSQPKFARAVNSWWSEIDGAPSSYDQPRISNLESGDRIPVKIQWFCAEHG